MEIVSQPQDELLAWDEGGDDCCVLLWNLCLQSRSPTRGPGQHGPRPSSPRARYYQKDRKEIDTSIQLPTDATHPCGIATFCRRLSSIDADWEIVVEAFRAARSRRGDKGRDDRKFLEALQYFTVHNLTWRALPAEFGPWNSVWKRFWRLSQRGVFEAMLAILAGMSGTAHLVQMVDSTVVRAHVSAAGAKGGRKAKPSGVRAAGFLPRST
jgi:transposase